MKSNLRLNFIDNLRAFAILMMLQGHFISGVLDPIDNDPNNSLYQFWLYCRGFTAPVFFTITGWIFTFLLIQNNKKGNKNPRIKKGLKRAFELILWGYVLRLNIPMLLHGELNRAFIFPDVLQIIGFSLLFIIIIYFLFNRLKNWTGGVFFVSALCLFILEPRYSEMVFTELPLFLAAYLTKANQGVFYLFPWVGYVFFGASMAYLFHNKTKRLRCWAIGYLVVGIWLVFGSSTFLMTLEAWSGNAIFRQVAYNNYLFIRLGDVCVLFGIFMFLEQFTTSRFWSNVGRKTLEIYIVHYFLFYGSLTGIGFYKYYKNSLSFNQSVLGALLFIASCLILVYGYQRNKSTIYGYLTHKLTLWRQNIWR
ncbi:MAG: heparan-alpha-glucosaminide N-acetyltransferase domain-containing protein [Flavobacteriaceae bacterium]